MLMEPAATMPPEPLTPPGCDLRDFGFMPLDVNRLRRSKAWLKCKRNPALAFYMLNLWTASWHDVPCASLEDDDDVLGDLAMCPPETWDALKDDILRGWVKCSDGRLYHPVVAEKARESWDRKLDQRWRTECARIKKHADRYGIVLGRPPFDAWVKVGCPQGQRLPVPGDDGVVYRGTDDGMTGDKTPTPPHVPGADAEVPRETASKGEGERQGEVQGQGQEQGEGQGHPKEKTAAAPPPSPPAPPTAADAPASRGKRLPADFQLPKAWGEWAMAKYPHWTDAIVRDLGVSFGNHWKTKTGKDATKLDWFLTWQNWCLSDITQRQHPAPKGATTEEDAAEKRRRRIAEGMAVMAGAGGRPLAIPATPASNVIDA